MWTFVAFVLVLNSVSRADNINICQNSTEKIVCPQTDIIHIHNANYGRTESNICEDENTEFDVLKDECILDSSLERVKRICENKSSCVLEANNAKFHKDPCEEFSKYLNVTYSCIPTLKEEVCTPYLPASLRLSCDDNKKLNILNVFYGRQDHYKCRLIPLFDLGNCESSQVPKQKIMNGCQGRNYCSFLTPIGLLNSCNLQAPYLEVDYQCIPE